jgi:hypothetical protein
MASSVVIDLTGEDTVENSSNVVVLDDVVSDGAVSGRPNRRKRRAPSETAPSDPQNGVRSVSKPRKVMEFTVAGKPRPLKRHKHGKGRTYNPSAEDQAAFRDAVTTPWPSSPLQGPVKVEMTFTFKLPKRLRRLGSGDQVHYMWRVGRPGKLVYLQPTTLSNSCIMQTLTTWRSSSWMR